MRDKEIKPSDGKLFEEGDLLRKVLDITLQQKLVTGVDHPTKVVDFVHPKQLMETLGLELSSAGVVRSKEVDEIFDNVVKYSVKTSHPHFYNQLYAGIDEPGLAAAWITEALNTNQHTFEVAPVFTVVEKFLIGELVKLFGWTDGDGIFAAGGSMSNMYGVALARYKRHPDIKKTGHWQRKPLAIITSDMSHYSLKKAGTWMGFGSDNVYSVKSDARGRMTPDALRQTLAKVKADGKEAFFVNATAGTTVYGAFDPIDQLVEVCKEEELWLHVDACWGGGLILSPKHKNLMKGIENVDSISWNPHKLTCAPLQCSVFLVKYKGLLQECNGSGATYLFQKDKLYDVQYDTGDKSIQCGRKPDSFKLWLMMKINGMDAMAERVDNAMSTAKYFEDKIRGTEGFRLVLDQHEFTNICFWYIPPSLRGLEETEEWWQKVHKVAPVIKSRMVLAGSALIGYQPLDSKNLVNFFRIVFTTASRPTEQHVDFVIDNIQQLAKDL